MPRPKGGYKLVDGTPVPGVTTVINRFKDSGALIYWAWKQGSEGKDYRETAEKAADAGTVAHEIVMTHLVNGVQYDPDMAIAEALTVHIDVPDAIQKKAVHAFEQWLEWFNDTGLEVVATEITLISEELNFGGTPDAILVDRKGRYRIGDWKSSNGIYPDHLIQCAAYKLLWEEHDPSTPINGGVDIVRFSKETADFEHRHFEGLKTEERYFLLLLQAYQDDKRIAKRVK